MQQSYPLPKSVFRNMIALRSTKLGKGIEADCKLADLYLKLLGIVFGQEGLTSLFAYVSRKRNAWIESIEKTKIVIR